MLVSGKMVLTKFLKVTTNQATHPLGTKSAFTFPPDQFSQQWSVFRMPPNTIWIHTYIVFNHEMNSSSIAKAMNQINSRPFRKRTRNVPIKIIRFERDQP